MGLPMRFIRDIRVIRGESYSSRNPRGAVSVAWAVVSSEEYDDVYQNVGPLTRTRADSVVGIPCRDKTVAVLRVYSKISGTGIPLTWLRNHLCGVKPE